MALLEYGFLDIPLNERLTNICEVIPNAREIARLGKEQIINGEAWRFLDRSLDRDHKRYVGWHIGELFREGTYGRIYKAFRMVVERRDDGLFDVVESPSEIIVKQTEPPAGTPLLPAEDVTAHTSEALLHVLAWQTMQKTQTPWAIPRPFEVFGDHADTSGATGWKSMSLCMSYVRGRTLYSYMQKNWTAASRAANGRFFVEVLAQVAYILHHLQVSLRLNHRDVKVNNILVRKRKEPFALELDGHAFWTHYEVTLIDFGFACVGCPPPRAPMTVFQAGSWFPFGELCCKVGRDLAQLLFCIHCYFPLTDYLPAAVAASVRSWMQIPWSGGVADGLHGFTKEGRPRRSGATGIPEYHTGIYEFLRRPDVDPAACAPVSVFRECARLYLSMAEDGKDKS
jgi:serine/threonine protein kinase